MRPQEGALSQCGLLSERALCALVSTLPARPLPSISHDEPAALRPASLVQQSAPKTTARRRGTPLPREAIAFTIAAPSLALAPAKLLFKRLRARSRRK